MTIEVVREFHVAVGSPAPERPQLPRSRQLESIDMARECLAEALDILKYGAELGCRMCLRLALETEELGELAEALQEGDLEAALDAQVDRRYIADGTTLELGLAGVFDEAFRRVHAANMAKLGPDGKPIIDATGKIRKPAGWVAPDLSDLVRREL
jgi:predicted HAD superfamily Cof-like phosphohydrolase